METSLWNAYVKVVIYGVLIIYDLYKTSNIMQLKLLNHLIYI
jgi:hypothetical protein